MSRLPEPSDATPPYLKRRCAARCCKCCCVCCSVLQCVAVCCSVLQYVKSIYNIDILTHTHTHEYTIVYKFPPPQKSQDARESLCDKGRRVRNWAGSVLQDMTGCCRVLQCVAGCCSVLQCVAVCCRVTQCVAVCCRVL